MSEALFVKSSIEINAPASAVWDALVNPEQTLWFVPLLALICAGLYGYRKQMLDMDKRLIFEDEAARGFQGV